MHFVDNESKSNTMRLKINVVPDSILEKKNSFRIKLQKMFQQSKRQAYQIRRLTSTQEECQWKKMKASMITGGNNSEMSSFTCILFIN